MSSLKTSLLASTVITPGRLTVLDADSIDQIDWKTASGPSPLDKQHDVHSLKYTVDTSTGMIGISDTISAFGADKHEFAVVAEKIFAEFGLTMTLTPKIGAGFSQGD